MEAHDVLEYKKERRNRYKIESENLAVPEIHRTDEKNAVEGEEQENEESSIIYDDVAIPEIHIRRKR